MYNIALYNVSKWKDLDKWHPHTHTHTHIHIHTHPSIYRKIIILEEEREKEKIQNLSKAIKAIFLSLSLSIPS